MTATPASRRWDDDPPTVCIGDVVETKKVTGTPTNPRSSAIVGHPLDLDLATVLCRHNAEESIAGFFGLEVSGGPRNEVS